MAVRDNPASRSVIGYRWRTITNARYMARNKLILAGVRKQARCDTIEEC